MKRILLIGMVSCLSLTVPVKAQLQKGVKYRGATMNLSGSQNQLDAGVSGAENHIGQFSFNPSVQAGRFINDNTMIGIAASSAFIFYWIKIKPDQSSADYRSNNQVYSLSPYIRHYKSLGTKWAVFLNSSASFSFLHNKNNAEPAIRQNGYHIGLQVTPGISYWITPRFALESDVNLLSLGIAYKDFQDSKSIYFNSGVTSSIPSYFSVRASWYLQKP